MSGFYGAGPKGTAFPSAPATGDIFLRTDRNLQYFYDGTRWLSTCILSLSIAQPDNVNPSTVTTVHRQANPFFGQYDIYIERFAITSFNSTVTSANYFTARLSRRIDAVSANLGTGLSMQNNTINEFTGQAEAINTVLLSTVDVIEVTFTETGTASAYLSAAITYRLVG